MRFTIILSILLATKAYSQGVNERELKTTINEVTVFLSGAQIFESGTTNIPSGKSLVKIKNLSPFMDDKSIQVKAEGDFTLLSVNHKFNYLDALKKDSRIDSLNKLTESLENSISLENVRMEVLNEKQSLMNQNKALGSSNAGATLLQLKQAMDFYESEITKIKEEEIKIRQRIDQKKVSQRKVAYQLKELNEQKTLPTSEIEIRISADKSTSGKFIITYLVANAGWFPKYDVRVHTINSPLELTYKAEVFQNTGVDWKNVRLKFSNGNPSQSGVVPELNKWQLNYARNTLFDRSFNGVSFRNNTGNVKGKVLDENGMSLPGVNVLVKGTTIGTVTDANGSYSLTLPRESSQLVFSFIGYSTQEIQITKPEINVKLQADTQMLSEVVTGYGLQSQLPGIQIRGTSSIYGSRAPQQIITTTVIENQTTVEIAIDDPYSIKSDGEKMTVDLKNYNINASYEYYAVPKIDKDAFLIARIINWDQYSLLEGEANLYFEDAYVGRSVLNTKALTDTLSISLGRDRNIVIGRTKVEQYSRRKTLGSNLSESRGFNIVTRNKKSHPIKLTIFDQIPVSILSDITVNAIELSSGKLDPHTGKVAWELTLNPQQQKELMLQYEVKYPKREKVILE